MEYIALSPRGLRPRASVQYIPYIPCARVITITCFVSIKHNNYYANFLSANSFANKTGNCMTSQSLPDRKSANFQHHLIRKYFYNNDKSIQVSNIQ